MEELRHYVEEEFFPRPVADELRRAIDAGSRLIHVQGPYLSGKRWVAAHVLRQRRDEQIVWVDARGVDEPSHVARQVSAEAGVAHAKFVGNARELTSFVSTILTRPTVLVWRHAEDLDEQDGHRLDVRHAIRSWVTAGARGGEFTNLVQIVLSATGPGYYFTNVADARLRMADLDVTAAAAFAKHLGRSVDPNVMAALHRAIGGHLHYLELALRTKALPLEDLCIQPLDKRGPFYDHYVRFGRWLRTQDFKELSLVKGLLHGGPLPAGKLGEELVERGVVLPEDGTIRYGIFRAFLEEFARQESFGA
ncbi:MAG TPA: hypothetical protein VM925_17880 [Labilithrix sp.]|nr:hypothetical protein [Labilithrix sp.]